MLLKFKQAVCFGGKDYGLGTHEVSEAEMKHPSFAVYVKAGLIGEADVVVKVEEKSSAALLAKVEALAPKPEPEKPTEETPVEPEDHDDDSEQKESPSRKTKSKSKR